jgi:ribonuclease P protein component
MIARAFTLKGKKIFERAQKEGKLFQSESFGLVLYKRGDDNHSQFGFIVSTKISKESVLRNRIKRALGEAVRYLLTDIKHGYDVIFLAKQSALRKTTEEIMRETKVALIKSHLIK